MRVNITSLRAQRHGEFLALQQRDPVTHRIFTEGERITVCAACLTPFAELSWQAIGGMHCGQTATTGPTASDVPTELPGGATDRTSANAVPGDEEPDRPTLSSVSGPVSLNPLPIKLREIPLRLH